MGGSRSSAVRAPCGFLNAGCQKRIYFGLRILHHTACSPALPQGEVSASAQPGRPSGSKAHAPSPGSEGRFPGRGATTTQLKAVPLLLGGQLRRPGPGLAMQAPGSRDEADPGNENVNQRRNKQNHDRDSSPRQTDRGCRCERWRGSGWGRPPGAVTQPTGGPGWTVHAEVSAKALRQVRADMRPGRLKQGGRQDHHQPGGRRRATPRSPSQAQERYQAVRASEHQQTRALRWAPETPSEKKAQAIRDAPLSCSPTMGPEPPTPGLQSQAASQPKGSIGSESIPPPPLTPGAPPQGLPQASLGGPCPHVPGPVAQPAAWESLPREPLFSFSARP